jgi:hypothetical protein
MLISSLGGGGDKPFHVNSRREHTILFFFFLEPTFVMITVKVMGTLFPRRPFFLIEGFWRLVVFNEA